MPDKDNKKESAPQDAANQRLEVWGTRYGDKDASEMTQAELITLLSPREIAFAQEIAMYAPGDSEMAICAERHSIHLIAKELGIGRNKYWKDPYFRRFVDLLRTEEVDVTSQIRLIQESLSLNAVLELKKILTDKETKTSTRLRAIQMAMASDPKGRLVESKKQISEGGYGDSFKAIMKNGLRVEQIEAEQKKMTVRVAPVTDVTPTKEDQEADVCSA